MKYSLPNTIEGNLPPEARGILFDLQRMFFDAEGNDQDVSGADCVDMVGELLSVMGLKPKPVTETLIDSAKAIIIYTATRAPEGIFTVDPIDGDNALLESLVDEGFMEYEHRIVGPGIHLRLTELGLEVFESLEAEPQKVLRDMNGHLLDALKAAHEGAHDGNGGRPHCSVCKLIDDAEEIR